MKAINLQSVDLAFSSGEVNQVTVHRKSDKAWFFTFTVKKNGKEELFTLETQRGALRTWADPRLLFAFLSERNILSGNFNLKEVENEFQIQD